MRNAGAFRLRTGHPQARHLIENLALGTGVQNARKKRTYFGP
jgi:hypothetical protein